MAALTYHFDSLPLFSCGVEAGHIEGAVDVEITGRIRDAIFWEISAFRVNGRSEGNDSFVTLTKARDEPLFVMLEGAFMLSSHYETMQKRLAERYNGRPVQDAGRQEEDAGRQAEKEAVCRGQYFAAIDECWRTLPDMLCERFPTPVHLRKYALIKAGYFDCRSIVAASKAEAARLAQFIKPMDQFAIVRVHEASVTVFSAKSQSLKAMGRQEFAASKEAVLSFITSLTDADLFAPAQARAA